MLQNVLTVKPLTDYKLHLLFEDRMEGVVDLSKMIEFTGAMVSTLEGQVQIDLPESEYVIATSAHQQKKLIICYGNLIKKSRLLKLENPHSLAILD